MLLVPQSLLAMQTVGVQVPVVAEPAHANAVAGVAEFGHSLFTPQAMFEHAPTTAPAQVAPKPQSASFLHEVLLVRAAADTWKSLNTTRPHCAAGAALTGVLNVIARSMSAGFVWARFLSHPYIQRWLRRAVCASCRGSVMLICPSVGVAPMFLSHCANEAPFGKV